MADLEELARRLEEATGPNYALEVAIRDAIDPGHTLRLAPANYTASLDAAIALCERLFGCERLRELIEAACEMWWSRPNYKAEEMPRFLCLAAVRALQSAPTEGTQG